MTTWQRINQICIGLVMVAMAVLLIVCDEVAYPYIVAIYAICQINDVGLVVDVVGYRTLLIHHEQRVGAGSIEGTVVLTTLHPSPVSSGFSQVHDGQVVASHEGAGFNLSDG